MRRLLLLLSVLLLGACWAVAQDTTNQTNPNSTPTSSSQTSSATASGETTVQGCLSGSSGNYTISDKNGTSYQLTGDTAKLSEHVGHEVKVTGTSSAASAAPSDSGTATGTTGQASGAAQQTLQVSSVKHIAKTCQSGGMSK
jgi:hypothetical protein